MDNVIRLAKEYYKTHSGGGNLHIVLDDGNTATRHVIFCLLRAHDEGDLKGKELAIAILEMSEDERDILYSFYDEYNPW